MADLVVKISGEISEFQEKLRTIHDSTETMVAGLRVVGDVASREWGKLADAAWTAVRAYDEEDKAIRAVTKALQLQGIYSAELLNAYKAEAEALEKRTGIQSTAILKGQAYLQNMIGQIPITKEMTMAAVQLSQKTGDVGSAFELLGKAALGNTTMLHKMGIEMVDHHNRTENLREVTQKIAQVFPAVGDGATRGLGGLKLLNVAFEDMEKAIGKRLMPAFELVINGMVRFFKAVAENEVLLDLITSAGIAAAAISGIAVAVVTGAVAFVQLKAALASANIVISASTLAVRGLVGATGFGLLLIVISEIYLNWGSIWPRMYALFKSFAENIGNLALNIGKIMLGAFTGSWDQIKEGWDGLKAAMTATLSTYNVVLEKKLAETQAVVDKAEQIKEEKNNTAANARENEMRRRDRYGLEIEKNKHATLLDQLTKFNADYVKLEQQETALLEAGRDEQNKKIWGKLDEQLKIVREMKAVAFSEAVAQQDQFDQEILASNQQFMAMSTADQNLFLQQNMQGLRDSFNTEKMSRDLVAKEKLERQVKEHNEYLKNQKKFGDQYATLYKAMHSSELEAFERTAGNLAAMSNSKNSVLKAIAKAGAVAMIGIKTARASMDAYADSIEIFGPIAGPGIGLALATAIAAYGAEQTAEVLGFAKGGMVSGGIPGVDSVPAFLQQGELVVPKQNFDETINAVAASRSAGSTDGSGAGGGLAVVELRLKDSLMEFIEAKLIERQHLHISLQG